MSDQPISAGKIWTCKIGEHSPTRLGADGPMRNAVADAYEAMTGHPPAFIFSGWGGTLDEGERAVVENRMPRHATVVPEADPFGVDADLCGELHELDTDIGYRAASRIGQLAMLAASQSQVAPATGAVPVPDGVVVAFGLLWHVRMGCDFPVPPGFSKNISPEEAAAKARRFLSDLLTQEQKGDGINRASELLAASQREGGE